MSEVGTSYGSCWTYVKIFPNGHLVLLLGSKGVTVRTQRSRDGRETDRRHKIVSAARDRFTSQGYDGTAIGDIAGDLGISKAAVGYYFPTKDAFIDEYVEPFLDDLEHLVVEADNREEAVAGYLRAVIAHHDVAVWMDTDPVLQNHPVHGVRLAAINDRLLAVVLGRRRSSKARAQALTVLGGVWRPVRELATPELAHHLGAIVDAALAGVD